MTREQIKEVLIGALKEIQSKSGKDCPPITEETRPYDDLPGFDSLVSLEATVDVEQKIGRNLVDGSIFLDGTSGLPRNLGAVIDAVTALCLKEAIA